MNAIKYALLIAATAWLGISGIVIEILLEWEQPSAVAHTVILSLLAIGLIVWLNKPERKQA